MKDFSFNQYLISGNGTKGIGGIYRGLALQSNIRYLLQCNPRVLFFEICLRVRFYSNLMHMGLYSRWGSITQGELNKFLF